MKNWSELDETGFSVCPLKDDYNDVKKVCKQLDIPCKQVWISPLLYGTRFRSKGSTGRTYSHPVWMSTWLYSLLVVVTSIGKHAQSRCLLQPRDQVQRVPEKGTERMRFRCNGTLLPTCIIPPPLGGSRCESVSKAVERRRPLQRPELLPLWGAGILFHKRMNQSLIVIPKVLFPVGHLTKKEVRHIAEQNGLVTAKKKDSFGICFVGERNMNSMWISYAAHSIRVPQWVHHNETGWHLYIWPASHWTPQWALYIHHRAVHPSRRIEAKVLPPLSPLSLGISLSTRTSKRTRSLSLPPSILPYIPNHYLYLTPVFCDWSRSKWKTFIGSMKRNHLTCTPPIRSTVKRSPDIIKYPSFLALILLVLRPLYRRKGQRSSRPTNWPLQTHIWEIRSCNHAWADLCSLFWQGMILILRPYI